MSKIGKSELIDIIASKSTVSKKVAKETLELVIDSIAEQVAAGNDVNIIGFGSFYVKSRAERVGHNPQTGEKMTIPASKSVGFKPSKVLKGTVS